MQPALSAVNLHKTYTLPHKRVAVLQGAHLNVAPGERVAIIGRSGAGKSTLLHVLGGLDHPDEAGGSVAHDGTDLYALSSRRRSAYRAANIGFVFQSYHLLPEMDVVENVMLPSFALGRPSGAARRRARELLENVGLADRLTHTPMELSGGEQQRVALARALMNDPRLILADEPTGNLDATTGGQVLELLFRFASGHALVLVTHSAGIAARCDRTLLLQDGLLVPG